MEQKIEIKTDGATKELIIRHGDAAPIALPDKFNPSGTITAPGNYARVRTKEIDPEKTAVKYDYERGFIVLEINPTDIFAATIIGNLLENKVIATLGINKQKTYNLADLVRVLKMHRSIFADIDSHTTLLGNLGRFKASIQQEVENAKDDRGNKKQLNEVTVKTDIALNFKIALPLFDGEAPSTCLVDICFDVRDGGISVWLESVELQELINTTKKGIIDRELANFAGLVQLQLG